MSTVHFVVPDGIDDPARPSGGNAYDRRVIAGLRAAGWDVCAHQLTGAWPSVTGGTHAALQTELDTITPGSVVIVDGLIASGAPAVVVPAAERLAVIVLMHMPLANDEERAVVTAARAVITTSHWTRDRLVEIYDVPPGAVHVAAPGVATAAVAPGRADGTHLVCVAAITPLKAHDVLLRALARLRDSAWSCRCVGPLDRDPQFVARLLRACEIAGIDDRVDFAGVLTGDELDDAYHHADVLVLPSRAETYGMVVTEALARGVPVIATDVGGVSEALGTTRSGRPGLLVPPDDDATLAGALRDWLGDAELRGRLRRAALARREALPDWSATIERIGRIIRMSS
jgi:glycosyltransferase involved in cell wall biosynthesis